MKVGQAARAAGLTAKQVRFYDDTAAIRRRVEEAGFQVPE